MHDLWKVVVCPPKNDDLFVSCEFLYLFFIFKLSFYIFYLLYWCDLGVTFLGRIMIFACALSYYYDVDDDDCISIWLSFFNNFLQFSLLVSHLENNIGNIFMCF